MTASKLPASVDNPFSPASRLPPELLVKIFKYLITHSSPTILLRICRHWASIASSVSSLWSRIDFSTPPTPLLQRCINKPIDVLLLSHPSRPASYQRRAARDVLRFHNHRIRKLVLVLSASHLRAVASRLSANFPILVDVSIGVTYDRYRNPDDGAFSIAIPPSPIRYLRLLHVKTHWVPGRFQNLTEFFLHDHLDLPMANPDPPMAIETFLGILESSPQLTVLSVANAGPRLRLDTATLPPATRVIHLHNLKRLYLAQEAARDVGWVLVHINIPVSADVKITVNFAFSRQTPGPPGLVFDLALPDHPGFPHLTDPRRCTYAVRHRSACVITAPNFAFNIIWEGPLHGDFDIFMIPFLRRGMARGSIEDLTVIRDEPATTIVGTVQWGRIFGMLHSLRKLRVEQPSGKLDLSIWGVFQTLPSLLLQDLRLSFLAFGEEAGDRERFVGNLVDYCAGRDQRGCRLKRLVIEAPLNPPPNLVLLLAPHVDHLEIREEFSTDEDVWALQFGSRRMFDLFQM